MASSNPGRFIGLDIKSVFLIIKGRAFWKKNAVYCDISECILESHAIELFKNDYQAPKCIKLFLSAMKPMVSDQC